MKPLLKTPIAQIGHEYYASNPTIGIPTQTLEQYAAQLDQEDPEHGHVLRMDIHHELAMTSSNVDDRAYNCARLTKSIKTVIAKPGMLQSKSRPGILRTHLPLISENWSQQAHTNYIERTVQYLENDRARQARTSDINRHSALRGRANEHLVSLALNTIDGIRAWPSYGRQEGSQYHQDGGKNYSWDITADSNGEQIDAGRYYLQVKSRKKSLSVCHHDIVRVNSSRLFNGSDLYFEGYVNTGRKIAESAKTNRTDLEILVLQSRLLNLLGVHGPSSAE